MKKVECRKLGNLRNLGNLGNIVQCFLIPSFQFCPTTKIKNLDLKTSEKNFRDFRGFQVVDLAKLLYLCSIMKLKRDYLHIDHKHLLL